MDIALTILEIKGVDAKALRAFRVLRPLRFLSGIPSKSTTFHLAKFLRLTKIGNISKYYPMIINIFLFHDRSPNRFERYTDGNDTTLSYCTSCHVCNHHLRNYWIGNVSRHNS